MTSKHQSNTNRVISHVTREDSNPRAAAALTKGMQKP
jgi:hypothetical protein